LALSTVTLAAQAPQQTPPAAPPAAAPAGDQQQGAQVFKMRIDLITTDVIVRDGNGQFVADLTKDNLTVLEDGVKQDVSSVDLIHGCRAYNLQAPAPPEPQEGIILPPAKPTNDAAGRIFLFFVDDLHMNFNDTPRIRALFKKMSTMLLHDGDMFGVVST